MKDTEVMELFTKTGAYKQGHFKLSSGLHSGSYLQCALVLQHPEYARVLGELLADKFRGEEITCVAGPALGGIIIAHEVANSLKTRCIFGERDKQTDKMVLRRGFTLDAQDRVLIVEDVMTTGKSIKELVDVVKTTGATVIGIGTLADRSSGRVDFGYEARSLMKLDIKTFNPTECPLCIQNIPLIKPGSRK